MLTMQQALTPGKPAHAATFQQSLSATVFGNVGVHVLPSSSEPFAMPPAPTYCPTCRVLNIPEPVGDTDEPWNLYPCHLQECTNCYNLALITGCAVYKSTNGYSPDYDGYHVPHHCDDCCTCNNCYNCGNDKDDACTCLECSYCGEYSDTESSYFCHEHTACKSCCECLRDDLKVPGWITRGVPFKDKELPHRKSHDTCYKEVKDLTLTVDPPRQMASFYLLDLPATMPATTPELQAIQAEAKKLQDEIVTLCDPVFQAYSFYAIGGELHYHPNVAKSAKHDSRNEFCATWEAMTQVCDRTTLTKDAVELFFDLDAWDSAFGGRAWGTCAKVLHSRLTDQIDPKTFVDRVFSLQHNGGSFLNKVQWYSHGYTVEHCLMVGNAHAAERTDLALLYQVADPEVTALFERYRSAYRQAHQLANKERRHLCQPPTKLPTFCETITESAIYKTNRREAAAKALGLPAPKKPKSKNSVIPGCLCNTCQAGQF